MEVVGFQAGLTVKRVLLPHICAYEYMPSPLRCCLLLFCLATLAVTTRAEEDPLLQLADSTTEAGTPGVIQIPLGGRVSLDELGPAIVAEDGTLRHITNWHSLTTTEQQVALKRIAARNKVRLDKLRDRLSASAAAGAASDQATGEAANTADTAETTSEQ